MDFTQDKLTKW